MMELILLERVEKLGQMGDIVLVKPGYARNYLLAKGKAQRATSENRKTFETMRTQLETQNIVRRTEAEQIAKQIEGLKIVLIRQAGEAGQLYGSVSARDLAEGVTEAGFTVGRTQISLERSIKTLGLHPVRIRLHPEVTIVITVNVARSIDEAETQAPTERDPQNSQIEDASAENDETSESTMLDSENNDTSQ